MTTYFDQMLAADLRAARARKAIVIAFAVSLLIHGLVLFLHVHKLLPFSEGLESNQIVHSPITATLAKRARTPAKATPQINAQRQTQATPTRALKLPHGKRLTSPNGNWSLAEKKEMDEFIKGLKPAPPKTGRDLAAGALAAARGMGAQREDFGGDDISTKQAPKGKAVDQMSMDMYFEAFINKLNRSAAFVTRDIKRYGNRKALVAITLNPDGKLRSFEILRAGDREMEIDYIKRVVERAVPVSAFPPDIRAAHDSLTMKLCILPPGDGGGGFSRTFGEDSC